MTKTFALLAAASSLALTACGGAAGHGPQPLTPLGRYALQVEPGMDRIALAVHDDGLSPNQRHHLAALADRYRASGTGAVLVEAPSGGDAVASERAWDVRRALEEAGVPGPAITVVSYSAPDPRAPVLAGFETLRAHVPQCGVSWTDLTANQANAGQSNFGCAVNANLAAQIADPRDILGRLTLGPADAGRRSVVFDNYRAGAQTSAPLEELVEGRVSQAVE